MNKLKLTVFSLIAVLYACQPTVKEAPIKVEPGVSISLAKYRASVIQDLQYQLYFTVPEEQKKDIEATELIQFKMSKNKKALPIDFKEDSTHLKKLIVNGNNVPIEFRNEHIIIANKDLKEGDNKIRIEFIAGNLSLNRNDEYLYTLLVPDRARTVFPVFDQPNLKATFDLQLNLPLGWEALANAPLKDSTTQEGRTIYDFATSDKISTYLFSFAAGKFKKVSRELNGIQMNFYHRETDEEKIEESLDPIFQIHSDAISFMEEYTQIPYPFQKFDFIALPDFQYGGMEHVGAIDYRASSLFLEPGSTQTQKIGRASLIAHETAHMWFGDLVTMEWFNDVWMKEVFANFMADKITKSSLESTNYDLKFLTSHFPSSYGVDRTKGANPIRQPLLNLKDAGSLYGNIIYHKAPIMMRQLERIMEEGPFRDGLREYLKKYAFGNATWPQLIEILDKRTDLDLKAWNQVWVNESSRPFFTYDITYSKDQKGLLSITQTDADSKNRLWPQLFEVIIYYGDQQEERSINMKSKKVEIPLNNAGKKADFILFNSSGQGYGVFPLDSNLLAKEKSFYAIENPVVRASTYVNAYENMLEGQYISPKELFKFLIVGVRLEKEELNLQLLTGYLRQIYWKFLSEEDRESGSLESSLWNAMNENSDANQKKIIFQTYEDIALSPTATKRLYQIWKNQQPPKGVKLSERDYTAMALELAVRDYPANILQIQKERISNEDRKKRISFLMPAVSSSEAVRDKFFNSLKQEENRAKESWVGTALSYLHHPLRTESSEKYLKESLELLAEIQATGDIFLPYRWLNATFSYYNTETARETVNQFLQAHPNYNPMLKAKILQATDDMFRAKKVEARNK